MTQGIRSPALRGFLIGQEENRAQNAQGLGQLTGLLGLQGALMQQQQFRTEMAEKERIRGLLPALSQAAQSGQFESMLPILVQMGPTVATSAINAAQNVATRRDTAIATVQAAEERRAANEALRRDLAGQSQAGAEERRAANESLRRDLFNATLANRQPPAPMLVYRKNQDGTISAVDFRSGKEVMGVLPPGAVTGEVRADFTASRQLQREYNAAARPWVDMLGSVSVYRNARAAGDTAQAAFMAAEALRRTARVGAQRFKGDVDAVLGGGYRGGSIPERIENFISQELTGTPTAGTMARLDNLINAAEDSALEQVGRQTQYYTRQARGRNLPLRQVIGDPFVQGTKVVFPDGTFAKFKDNAAASAAAQKWVEQNQ